MRPLPSPLAHPVSLRHSSELEDRPSNAPATPDSTSSTDRTAASTAPHKFTEMRANWHGIAQAICSGGLANAHEFFIEHALRTVDLMIQRMEDIEENERLTRTELATLREQYNELKSAVEDSGQSEPVHAKILANKHTEMKVRTSLSEGVRTHHYLATGIGACEVLAHAAVDIWRYPGA